MYKTNTQHHEGRVFPSIENAIRCEKLALRNQPNASFSVFAADDDGQNVPYAAGIKKNWEWETIRF